MGPNWSYILEAAVIRMTRLSDYASMLLIYFARDAARAFTARDLAEETSLPLPTVSKILKALVRAGLLVSHRGLNGGYNLGRDPERISLAEILAAIEGPISLTDCGGSAPGGCSHEQMCPVENNWKQINRLVHDALSRISLAEMSAPLPESLPFRRSSLPRFRETALRT